MGVKNARKRERERERSHGSVRGNERKERRRGREIAVARIPEIAKGKGDKIGNRNKDVEVISE